MYERISMHMSLSECVVAPVGYRSCIYKLLHTGATIHSDKLIYTINMHTSYELTYTILYTILHCILYTYTSLYTILYYTCTIPQWCSGRFGPRARSGTAATAYAPENCLYIVYIHICMQYGIVCYVFRV